jgi:general secretion pathway protein D
MMMRKPAWTIVIMILLFSACVSFGPHYYKLGNQAEINKNWDEAIKYYEQAIRENPKEYTYKMSLTRVKLAASLSHIKSAQELAAEGKKEEALKEYEKALSYDPQNRAIVEAMRHLTEPPSAEEEVKPLKLENPVKLDVPREKIELKFTEASLRSIFLALGKHAGVNIIFDEQFRDAPLTIDIGSSTKRH